MCGWSSFAAIWVYWWKYLASQSLCSCFVVFLCVILFYKVNIKSWYRYNYTRLWKWIVLFLSFVVSLTHGVLKKARGNLEVRLQQEVYDPVIICQTNAVTHSGIFSISELLLFSPFFPLCEISVDKLLYPVWPERPVWRTRRRLVWMRCSGCFSCMKQIPEFKRVMRHSCWEDHSYNCVLLTLYELC